MIDLQQEIKALRASNNSKIESLMKQNAALKLELYKISLELYTMKQLSVWQFIKIRYFDHIQ